MNSPRRVQQRFSKPHTRGSEEDRLGRDLALYASKQKSLGTMNNKSIQKKTKKKQKSEGSLFGAELSAGGEQLLAKKGLKNCGLWAAQQAPLANPICRNEIQRKDDVW